MHSVAFAFRRAATVLQQRTLRFVLGERRDRPGAREFQLRDVLAMAVRVSCSLLKVPLHHLLMIMMMKVTGGRNARPLRKPE